MRPRKKISMYIMAAIYLVAGILHFVKPDTYTRIVPHWLPYPLALVYISGVVEITGGLLLLPAATRRTGAWLIILLLIAVFPANVQMSINYYRDHHPYFWLTIIRLPLQVVLIWWAWKFAKKYPKK
jgi:uncharacterized membrane protein